MKKKIKTNQIKNYRVISFHRYSCRTNARDKMIKTTISLNSGDGIAEPVLFNAIFPDLMYIHPKDIWGRLIELQDRHPQFSKSHSFKLFKIKDRYVLTVHFGGPDPILRATYILDPD